MTGPAFNEDAAPAGADARSERHLPGVGQVAGAIVGVVACAAVMLGVLGVIDLAADLIR